MASEEAKSNGITAGRDKNHTKDVMQIGEKAVWYKTTKIQRQ